MRVAIYVRVSTEEQSQEGYSIAAQKERCSRFVESQEDWEITKIYADPGYSAKNLNRPAIKQLLEDIELHAFDVVVVYRLDRLVRSVLDLHQLLKLFEKNNVKFKSVTEVFDTTTAMGKFFITMVGAMAEWERNNLGERVSFGMEQMTREGKWKGGKAGYGHDYIDGRMVINEREADILRTMYDWYLSGMSDRKIAIRLNDMGILTKSGREWNEPKVRYALINQKNIGNLEYGKRVNKDKNFTVNDIYPPIVDIHTFERANTLRKARVKYHGRQVTSNYIFSGTLVCARCGNKMKGIKAKDRKRYRCRGALYKKCDMPTLSESIIEHNFLKKLKQIDFERYELKEQDLNSDDNKKIKRLHQELDKIKQRRKKWQYAWANGMMPDGDFQDRLKEEQEQEQSIHDQLRKLDYKAPAVINQDIIKMISDAANNWNKLDDMEKKQLIQITIDKIVVDRIQTPHRMDRAEIKEIAFN
ncbi:integrase [Lentibacillus populi]|uniref:Integrase n=1 Tax=Lentibacillus populi TaxID=1827502 RepID=A0A9W5X818_9BACI|nr:recombinase family protein [Lentibacillus populi]GGB61289.1 integrase [Lentibacillus populi]